MNQLQGEEPIPQAPPIPVNSGNPQSCDGIARLGDFLHFHAPFGPDKLNVALGMPALDFIRDGESGMDVSSSPSS